MKKLKDLALKISEEEYYNNRALMHYSMLSTFNKGGFDSIKTLFDKKESPSLLLGSIVDCIITEGMDSFNEKYYVTDAELKNLEFMPLVKCLLENYSNVESLDDLSDAILSELATSYGIYANNWKDNTRAIKIREACGGYFKAIRRAGSKIVVNTSMYEDAIGMVNALRLSEATKFLYLSDNPFEENIERVYQPIFNATFDGITYTIKPDELIVLHDKKQIICTDLKTTGKPEYNFAKSFIEWNYQLQARLYYRVLKEVLSKDDYFKDFNISNWYFVTINRVTKTPLIWEYPDTKEVGTLTYGRNDTIICKDPFDLAKELYTYLNEDAKVPIGININKPNNLIEWLNKN